MRTREEMERRQRIKCRNFNGTGQKVCMGGFAYPAPKSPLACFQEEGGKCEGYSAWTDEEWAAKEAEMTRRMDLMRRGLSACCEAPFDESQVIRSGRYKGHGPHFCSKCKRLTHMV